jgi:hypothetical protein
MLKEVEEEEEVIKGGKGGKGEAKGKMEVNH